MTRSRLRVGFAALVAAIGLTLAACAVPPGSGQGPADFVAPPTRDVVGVAYGTDPAQVLDLHLPPAGTAGPLPVIVYLHVGGWTGGSRADVPQFLRAQVTRRGVAVVSVDYRVAGRADDGSPVHAFPVPDQDVDQAIRYVRAHAATWNLDPHRIVVAGASAGGQLALLAAAAPGEFVAPDLPAALRNVSPAVQGVMDFVGPSDLVSLLHDGILFMPGSVRIYLGCPAGPATPCSDALASTASPISHIHAGLPPAYLVFGAQDGLVPPGSQGIPLATAWASARGDFAVQPIFRRGTYFEIAPSGHNLDPSNFSVIAMQAWLDALLAGTLA